MLFPVTTRGLSHRPADHCSFLGHFVYVHVYEGRTERHEQLFFLHANWEEQTKESAVVDGTSCCVTLECLVTSIACIT